jgi:hypothetical protein
LFSWWSASLALFMPCWWIVCDDRFRSSPWCFVVISAWIWGTDRFSGHFWIWRYQEYLKYSSMPWLGLVPCFLVSAYCYSVFLLSTYLFLLFNYLFMMLVSVLRCGFVQICSIFHFKLILYMGTKVWMAVVVTASVKILGKKNIWTASEI